MSPLLEQFLSETRDVLQEISEQLLAVEKQDDRTDILNEMFRLVHTLKGNTGLFDYPDLTRVLHAAEDLMSHLRDHPDLWEHSLTDILFDAMDFVSNFCESIEENDGEPGVFTSQADDLSGRLRHVLEQLQNGQPISDTTADDGTAPAADSSKPATDMAQAPASPEPTQDPIEGAWKGGDNSSASEAAAVTEDNPDIILPPPPSGDAVTDVDEESLLNGWRQTESGSTVLKVTYQPVPDCFFQGDDPLFTASQAPGVFWGNVTINAAENMIEECDPFQCDSVLTFLTNAEREEIDEHFRYVPDQITIEVIDPLTLLQLRGDAADAALSDEALEDISKALKNNQIDHAVQAAHSLLELCGSHLKVASALRWLIRLADEAAEPHHPMVVIVQHLRELLDAESLDFYSVTAEEVVTSHEAHVHEEEERQAEEAAELEAQQKASQAANNIAQDDADALNHMLAIQRRIIAFTDSPAWANGRLKSAIGVITKGYHTLGLQQELDELKPLFEQAFADQKQGLLDWIDARLPEEWHRHAGLAEFENSSTATVADTPETDTSAKASTNESASVKDEVTSETQSSPVPETPPQVDLDKNTDPQQAAEETKAAKPKEAPATKKQPAATNAPTAEAAVKAEMEAEAKATQTISTSRSVKVDQEKIDRLMNLIGEMIVAKNSLPFLAKRAEEQYGLRDLGREIKEQYAVVNRIAEEMQDSIMQIRMMPFSFITMRFPRLVRDISRRLGKDVQLVVEGEETEADKNIIESLAEPLIHIVRNSLDHGIEMPDVRRENGKSGSGTLTIRASQEADRVLIEILDDGKGIDPEIIKQKALEKGMIDEAAVARLSDREAVNLVLLPGFSTADEVSDLSGRGVGMDAVRSAVEKVNGAMSLDSEAGKGTHIRISLPMSIAVTRVMIVESDGQLMGVPMDQVLETVRVHKDSIYAVKHVKTTVLRDRIVPLKSLNQLLVLPSEPQINEEEEYAVLIARVGNDVIGLLVDDFRGSVDIIQKPMTGVMSALNAYSGAALIGDGSVLMVLNLKEVL